MPKFREYLDEKSPILTNFSNILRNFADLSANRAFFAANFTEFRLFVFGKFGGRAKERAQSSGGLQSTPCKADGGCKVERAEQRVGAK